MEFENKCIKNKKNNSIWLDAFRGCLIGGAAGDALGYPVEFLSFNDILKHYGSSGITMYEYDCDGVAQISDDTQMTLFTATGILSGITDIRTYGSITKLKNYVWNSYQNWCEMQMGFVSKYRYSWLCDIPQMAENREPGRTCINSLIHGNMGSIEKPINYSKGCGGIMRVAPIGLYFNRMPETNDNIRYVDETAAEIAALTHGHKLGYMSASALVHIINRIVFSKCTLFDAINDAIKYMNNIYIGQEYLSKLIELMEKAIKFAKNDLNDIENIKELGEGWVAEETLAIAIYCSLKYQYDFSKALQTAVNHDGDSDSTGAVTGNILGALWGYKKIPDKWKKNLECFDIILEIADDLCYDYQINECKDYYNSTWFNKYIRCKHFICKKD